jgi:nucleotide-binding universal stress UspA family protein
MKTAETQAREVESVGRVEIRRILCPVDFSDVSLRALKQAAALAAVHGAVIEALHVMPREMPPLSGLAMATAGALESDERERLRADLSGRLERFVDASADGVRVFARIEEGSAIDRIVAWAREADMVVVGSHGHGGLERLALGSTAEKTQLEAPCPVLTVPPVGDVPGPTGTFARILCAVDFTAASHRAVDWAAALAGESRGRLLLLHVLESGTAGDDAAERLRRLLPPGVDRLDGGVDVRGGKPPEQILQAAADHACDLIALGTGKGNEVGQLLFGSTAYDVSRRAPCPVLTVRALSRG